MPISWYEQLPADATPADEALIVCAGCRHTLAHHVELNGWWPCLLDDCRCPNWIDATGCPYCHGKRFVVDERGIEHKCGCGTA